MNTENTTPACVGFIMDGNRRWAKERDLETLLGHQKGYEVFKEVVGYIKKAGIEHSVFYAFSSENWERSEKEVAYLMRLLAQGLEELSAEIDEHETAIRIIGDRSRLPEEAIKSIQSCEEKSAKYTERTVWIAIGYGGRAELVSATNQAIEIGEMVTEKSFDSLLWSKDLPEIDIIVRPGGEKRLSNFMTWKSVYSELYFIDTLWPDFSKADFDAMLAWYGERVRRKGT